MSSQPRTTHRPSSWRRAALICLVLALMADQAFAAGSGGAMPWDDWLTTIANSITGPVAKAVGVIAIALTGLGVAVSEGGSWVRKGLSVMFGLSIAFSASTFFLGFLGYAGGAAF